MKKSLIYVITIFFLISCNYKEEEKMLLQKEYNELQLIYVDKLNEYGKKEKLLRECERNKSKPTINKSDYELIGTWDTPILYGGGKLILYKENGIYFKTESFSDGSKNTSKMRMVKSGNRMVFNSLERVSSDRWVVLPNGKLEVRDKDGLIYSINK